MVSVIIKTHNDHKVLDRCIQSLRMQTYPYFRIVIMDTASSDTSYVRKYVNEPDITVLLDNRDLGFCVGNNIATQKVIDESKYILYLNPDAFVEPTLIQNFFTLMENDNEKRIGVISGKLRWYDLQNNLNSDIIDSAGIFQTWYGRWYNRGMGKQDVGQYDTPLLGVEVPVVCGALLFCRKEALDAIQYKPGEYFDSSFFMYKDDIDFSLRIKKAGFSILYTSKVVAYHCRGWQRKDRQRMPKRLRLCAAQNEIKINRQLSLLKYTYSRAKFILVKLGF